MEVNVEARRGSEITAVITSCELLYIGRED